MTRPNERRPKCGTCKPERLLYLAAHDDAQRRLRKGERQQRCPECGLWKWSHQFKVKP